LTEEELRQLEKQWIVEEEKRIFDEKARKQEDELLHQRQYMARERVRFAFVAVAWRVSTGFPGPLLSRD
jgi:hypothetical protein